ncbi:MULTISPECIES: hypothetical protein [Enterobacteriaceae]
MVLTEVIRTVISGIQV